MSLILELFLPLLLMLLLLFLVLLLLLFLLLVRMDDEHVLLIEFGFVLPHLCAMDCQRKQERRSRTACVEDEL